MPSPRENLSGPGNPLRKEPPDAKEFAGLKQSALRRFADAENKLPGESLRSRLQRSPRPLPRALRHAGYRPTNRYLVFQVLPHTLGLGPEVWRVPVALPPTRLGVLGLRTDRRISVLPSESDEVLARDRCLGAGHGEKATETVSEYRRPTDLEMIRPTVPNRSRLQGIARRAMVEHGLLPDFSPAALAETEASAKAASEPDPSIRDLRGLLWASIDNDDSRDLDQLTVAQPMADGVVKILVAVADVDATVKEGSAIDAHARTNTTSVYTAAEVFPMLPEKLSTDFTSLGEGQERLAIVIEMVVAPDGALTGSSVYRAVRRRNGSRRLQGSMSNSASRIVWRRR